MLWNVMRRSSSSKEVYVCACVCVCVCVRVREELILELLRQKKGETDVHYRESTDAYCTYFKYLLSKKKRDVFVLSLDPELKIPQQKLLFSGVVS